MAIKAHEFNILVASTQDFGLTGIFAEVFNQFFIQAAIHISDDMELFARYARQKSAAAFGDLNGFLQ